MGWFIPAGAVPGDEARPRVASVRRTSDGKTAGGAVVLGVDAVLTCAHVVNDALGRAMFETRPPGLEELFVEVKGARRTERYPARVAHWIPARTRDGEAVPDGDGEWLGDLAVLRIDAPPGGALTPDRRAAMVPGRRVRAWHGSGRGATFADLRVAALDGPIGYLDGESTGMAVGPGYSGGPLWCEEDGAVVGLVTAHFMPPHAADGAPLPHSPQHMIRRSWGIPWQQVEVELRRLDAPDLCDLSGTSRVEDARAADPEAFGMLVEAIGNALPSPYSLGDVARQLALACDVGQGSPVSPPPIEEFAAFLLRHPRALAACTEILRPRNPAATNRMLVAGRFSKTPLLLSPRERHRLHQLLRKVDRSVLERIPEAVREAAKRVAVPTDGGTLDILLDKLEKLSGDGHSDDGEPRVPALLRVVEYVAVLCPPPRQAELRLWSDGVRVRLGIPEAALRERRSDAQDWGRMLRGGVPRKRVLVQVARAERGRHRLRIWCDEGTGPRQVSADSAASHTASQAARELLRVLESLTPSAQDGGRPLVEVLVDRADLNLPVDEWAAQVPGEIVPGVLGVEFPLVVHCPELLRRHERFLPDWRERWRQLDSGKTLVVADPAQDPHQVYYELMGRLDTVRVSVDVPQGPRDAIVQICLAVGIPVVVWDRGRDTPSHVTQHMAEVATRELPDGVRVYRANARGTRAPEFPGRPVLAWADADRTVPRLHLSEPQESA
ncbi:trypsin-like peptidase domain-containing protein [Streptomyces ferrugineus]|uniref:Trypsin-like peptidase domain-containing protein n=1 Tax=Streptomyces ferrugineus TaxID=1413221 RepID=A0A7M2SK71_9ACTN|nr:trypsin-like peptidase domain-containing protein [Streptomyces ferrugineus]QOV36115.1 trypsin-like peptidase domain-containing protein [Streptomyces ferrugineus]